MKLTFFLCALVLSLQGRCASLTSSQPTAATVRPGHDTVEKVKQNEETNILLPCGLLAYLTVLFWWTFTAKSSLDKILKNVLQDIARCSS